MKKIKSSLLNLSAIILGIVIGLTLGHIGTYFEVHFNDEISGRYIPVTNTYICQHKNDQACILHEQGHAYDFHNIPMSMLFMPQRSQAEEFRANIDIIENCMFNFYNGIGYNPNKYSPDLSKDEVLQTTYTMLQYYYEREYDDTPRYREMYAHAYKIMKWYRWDIYHYDDVENMIAYKANYCQNIQTEATVN